MRKTKEKSLTLFEYYPASGCKVQDIRAEQRTTFACKMSTLKCPPYFSPYGEEFHAPRSNRLLYLSQKLVNPLTVRFTIIGAAETGRSPQTHPNHNNNSNSLGGERSKISKMAYNCCCWKCENHHFNAPPRGGRKSCWSLPLERLTRGSSSRCNV